MLRDTDLLLPDVLPVTLTRVYRPLDTRSRPFGIGATHPYQMFIVGDGTGYSYLEVVLADGGRIRYDRISPGTDLAGAVLEHTATPTQFYKSKLTWNWDYGWNLQFKDGSLWKFYSYGAGPALISMSDRRGNTVTINRTSYKQISKVVSPNGRWMEFTYDSSDRVTQAKDNSGRTVNYTYDASGRLWKVTNPLGQVKEYTYDSSHRMLTVKDARGIVCVTNQYDANGRVSLQTQADGTTYQFAYTLDTNGKVIQTDMTDPRGNVYRATFNSKGYALTDTFALGTSIEQTVTYQRQASTHFLQSVTDALNRRTDFSYDSLGNLTSITRLAGTGNAVTTSFTYEPIFNQLASVTGPLNHTTSLAYDTKGNPTSVTDPLGNQVSFAYNSAGQPISATSPLNKTVQFGYDGGDLVSITNPLGQTVSSFVDSAGRVLSMRDPLGQTTKSEYDAVNRPTRVIDPLQSATSFAYDANGNLLSVTDARNNAVSYTYDNMDRVQTRTDPLTRASSYQYNNNGNINQITDRKNQVTNHTYDALERLSQVTYADASTTSYAYDGGSRLTQITDSLAGAISYTYDDLDRVASETTPQGTVSYTYDALGRRASMSVPGQSTVNYTYDHVNRLTQITQGSSTVSFAYDAASRTTSQTLPNGVVSEYSYDDASRLVGLAYRKGANVLGNLTYEYDAAGRRTRTGGSLASTGLPQAVATTSYNAANRQTSFGSQTLSYDNNGNLTSDGVTSFGWNARNQLVSMTSAALSASFQYDGLGRRQSKTINGSTLNFVYDGPNIVQEQAGGSATANLLTGGIDNLFTRSDSSGTTTALRDALGSIIALTDSNGSIQTQYGYEPFGKTTASGTTTGNTQKYTSRDDDGTGLYYYRTRYYSPSFQRFISEDRIGLRGGINLFAYVKNNPVSLNDPFGYKPSDPWISEEGFCGFLGGAGSAAAGFGDTLTGGLTDKVRDWTAANGAVDKGSGFYSGGEYGAYAWAMGTGVAIAWELVGAEVVAGTVLKGPIPNVTAQSLAEQLALEEAMANGKDIIMEKLADAPRLIANYGPGEWVKMQWVHRALDGSKIVIHWFRNLTTGQKC
jgi:RHS repeat-associated protein